MIMIDMKILRALLRKEFTLMKRNPIIPKIIFAMPVMVMLVAPLITNLDVKSVGVAIVDNDHSQLSRRIVADMSASGSIIVASLCDTHTEAMYAIENGEADVLVTIPPDYSKNLGSSMPKVDVEANGVNAMKGMIGAQYVTKSIVSTITSWLAENGIDMPQADFYVINRYNPTLDFRNYMIPALMVILLIIICGFLPALNLVSEKETGTIDAMNVSPVSRSVFILSKLIPFWLIGMLVITVGILIGWLVYGLVPMGSVWAIYLAAVLFSLVMSGFGVTVANYSSTMLQSIFVMFAVIMVFQLMSGLFTPIDSMPEWAQCVTYMIPPRYFIEIMRSVYLKGTTVAELAPQYLALAGFAIALFLMASISYKKQA